MSRAQVLIRGFRVSSFGISLLNLAVFDFWMVSGFWFFFCVNYRVVFLRSEILLNIDMMIFKGYLVYSGIKDQTKLKRQYRGRAAGKEQMS